MILRRSMTLIALVVPLVLFANSCGLFIRQPYSPLGMMYTTPLSLDEITREIASRTHPLETLWARMKVTLRDPKVRGKQYFLATLLFRNPDEVRLRGSRTLTSTLFEILLRGEHVQVYLNGDRELFAGTLDDVRRDPEILNGIDPNVFVSLVRAESLLSQALTSSTLSQSGQTKRHYVFAIQQDSTKQVFAVRKSDLLIQQLGIYDRNGRLQLIVSYDRYILADGALMPADVTITFSPSGATMRLNVTEYKLNPPLAQQVFSNLGTPDARRHPLTDLLKKQGL